MGMTGPEFTLVNCYDAPFGVVEDIKLLPLATQRFFRDNFTLTFLGSHEDVQFKEVLFGGVRDGALLFFFRRKENLFAFSLLMERKCDRKNLMDDLDEAAAKEGWRELAEKKRARLIEDEKIAVPPRQAIVEGVSGNRSYRGMKGPGGDRGLLNKQFGRGPNLGRKRAPISSGMLVARATMQGCEVFPTPQVPALPETEPNATAAMSEGEANEMRQKKIAELREIDRILVDLPNSPFFKEKKTKLEKEIMALS